MKTLAATNNAHKLAEFRSILKPYDICVNSAYSYAPGIPDIEESGKTFEENAALKAEYLASAINKTVFADDSGLEVLALDGEPGIFSARYCGENATDIDRVQKILRRLKNRSNRSAQFVCVIAIATPTGLVGTAEGVVKGRISTAPSGSGGFGYDPIFIPEGYQQTFSEISGTEKNLISHRYHALMNAYNIGLFNSFN